MQQMLLRGTSILRWFRRPLVPIATSGPNINVKRDDANRAGSGRIVSKRTLSTRKTENGKSVSENEISNSTAGGSTSPEIQSKLPRYNPEKLVVDQFSKPVQQIWEHYKSNPATAIDLRKLCKGSRDTILEVARMGKTMSMADDPETYNCAMRLLFDAERTGSRFAALFIVNMALRVESSTHLPMVAKAVDHVFQLASLPGDLAALTLKARYLQHQGELDDALVTYRKAYKLLETFVPEKLEQEVVGGPDFLYAFAMFKLNSGDPADYYEALDMLKEAALEGGHMAACLQLQGKLEPAGTAERPEFAIHSPLHHQLLLKLAASGHHAAAHELGRLYALPEEEFKLLDLQLQQDIKDSTSVSLKASLPLGFKRMMLTLNAPAPGSGVFGKLKAKFKALRLSTLYSRESKTRSLSQSLSKQYHQNIVTKGNERFYKALEWFHFGRAVYYHPAMIEGARLAKKLGLPFETGFFYDSARTIPGKERQHPFQEGIQEKEVYENAGQPFLDDGRKVYESDHQGEIQLVQRILSAHDGPSDNFQGKDKAG